MSSRARQSGFTLVEIAIVLVIIGLLLGGILKGQEMITQAKIKNIVNDFNGITAAVNSYQDRYRALPGDDLNAAGRWSGTVSGASRRRTQRNDRCTLGRCSIRRRWKRHVYPRNHGRRNRCVQQSACSTVGHGG
jgi:prepilin-type N-terminal cleavage/methylation domain-containing protein